jgi:hypothetical protein
MTPKTLFDDEEEREIEPEPERKMTRNDIIKEDLAHIHSDCRRIENEITTIARYMSGLYPDAIITQGRFFSMGALIKDLNKHWMSIIEQLKVE